MKKLGTTPKERPGADLVVLKGALTKTGEMQKW